MPLTAITWIAFIRHFDFPAWSRVLWKKYKKIVRQTPLDGRSVRLGAQSRNLSNVGSQWMGDQKFIISSPSVLWKAR
jgi:hypothetical protein